MSRCELCFVRACTRRSTNCAYLAGERVRVELKLKLRSRVDYSLNLSMNDGISISCLLLACNEETSVNTSHTSEIANK